MSTFRGVVREFPDIRIDFFRTIPGTRPPLACFLSHIHSDHLAGLESLKSPFIYCSAATKELLLRLERYPHRMNFAKGILEARKQHYKHLKNLLKPIALETPTCIELSPRQKIQVTLFDANHCTGAVMFLIEDACNAILYTGDIRSEPWFVNRLARSPFLIQYSSGLKTLDCIYLDTSNAGAYVEFPTKAEGLKELIEKVSEYPIDTTFHFAAWTFGYEEIWMMLSRVLDSPIHVDKYKMGLYQALRGDSASGALSSEAPVLAGYKCGNTDQPGILTDDPAVRLHSCEKGTACPFHDGKKEVIWIQPIVCRRGSMEVAEVGIGGGGGDLTQKPELELDDNSVYLLIQLLEKVDHSVAEGIEQKLWQALHSSLKSLSLAGTGMDPEEDEISLDELTKALIRSTTQESQESDAEIGGGEPSKTLPKIITFPYSRHSSHSELCDLLKAFRPADVYPCTVDEDSWHEGISIETMFGEYCSQSRFRHDSEMRALQGFQAEDEDDEEDEEAETHRSRASSEEASIPPNSSPAPEDVAKSTSLDGDTSPEATRTKNGATHQQDNTPINAELDNSLTPNSLSRRRKAIEGLVQGPAKRPRLIYNSPNHPQSIDSDISLDDITDGTTRNKIETLQSVLPRATVLKCRDALLATNGNFDDASNFLMATDENTNAAEDPQFSTYYDPRDEVHRCTNCGWEIWLAGGSCHGPDCEATEDDYEELVERREDVSENSETLSDDGIPLSPMQNLRQVGTDLEIDPVILTQLKEKYLDYQSSAYSDEDDDRSEEYEMNSMIDNASIHSGNTDGEESNSEDSDDEDFNWKASYMTLLRKHNALLHSMQLADDSVLPASSDVSDAEGYEQGDLRIVEVDVQDPTLTEFVLVEHDSDPQSSSMSDELEELRKEASEFTKESLESLSSSYGNNDADSELEL